MAGPSLSFRKAEASFLGHPQPRTVRGQGKSKSAIVYEAVTKMNTAQFFDKLLTDEIEKQLWTSFITGTAPVEEIVDGVKKIVMHPVELNAISFAAFKLAVAYKRGQPSVTVKTEDDKGVTRSVEINIIGATPQYFEKVAKAKGLLVK